jgi:hypothetical protein
MSMLSDRLEQLLERAERWRKLRLFPVIMRYRLRMRRQNLRSTVGDDVADDDSQPVMVPRSDRMLTATSPERAQRLRKHLVMTLRTMKDRAHPVSPLRPEPVGFAARNLLAFLPLRVEWRQIERRPTMAW